MRLGVVGATGRMGRAVVRLAVSAGVDVVFAMAASDVGRDAGSIAGVGPVGHPVVGDLSTLPAARTDVIIDFSSPEATLALVAVAAQSGAALVSGTTGLDGATRDALDVASARVPVLWEPNMSVGVYVLSRLVAQASAALAEWDAEIVEVHHRAKVDAPSGTALRLVDAIRAGRGESTRVVHGRHGRGARETGEVGMHALRGGSVVGDHVVHLFGGGERLELAHRADDRDVFARGALRAAAWLVGRAPGRYGLADVLGLA